MLALVEANLTICYAGRALVVPFGPLQSGGRVKNR